MSKSEKEISIITAIKALPNSGFGKYHYQEELTKIIDKVMGYGEVTFPSGRFTSNEIGKVSEIVRRMVEKKIIAFSKSGTMFKLL